jgi:hypothetical protein
MDSEQHATAYLKNGKVIIHAQARSTAGVYLAAMPVRRLPLEAGGDALGRALRDALDAYQAEVPHPTTWRDFGADVLKASGVRSWRALQVGTACCTISRNSAHIMISPSHNGGTSGDGRGFQPAPSADVALEASATPDRVGAALLEAFSRCT